MKELLLVLFTPLRLCASRFFLCELCALCGKRMFFDFLGVFAALRETFF